MLIILKKTVAHLGSQGQMASVKAGYANNFLIPKGYAILATSANQKAHQAYIDQMKANEEAIENQAIALSQKLEQLEATLVVESDQEKIFGTITPLQITRALQEQGANVTVKQIDIVEPIKQLGKHKIRLLLHPKVTASILLTVVAKNA